MCTRYHPTGRSPVAAAARPWPGRTLHLDAATQARAEAAGRAVELPADSVLWHDEMAAFPAGLLCAGIVRQQRHERDGQRRIANLILPGEAMTARSLARTGYALEAATPVRLLRLPAAAFDTMSPDGPQRDGPQRDGPQRDGPQRDGPQRDGAQRDGAQREGAQGRLPGLRDAAYRAFQDQLDRLRWLTWAILALNTEARLCAFLDGAGAMLPVQSTAEGRPLIHLVLRRRDIADLLSTSVESVCRVLKRLERDGVIRLHGPARVEVRDRAALQRGSSGH